MEEKNIMESYKERNQSLSSWDNRRFAELMAYSAKEAAQYCVDCGIDTEINGVNVKDLVKGVESPNPEELAEETTINPEETIKDKTLSIEELREILKANNIEFKGTLGLEKLVILAQKNNLI